MARESDAVLQTLAWPEISVASTKAFSAQLTMLALLAIGIARLRGVLSHDEEVRLVEQIEALPTHAIHVLGRAFDPQVREVAAQIAKAGSVLYFCRGSLFPIAMEGALKLKEISYIHAEGFAAGEMKHGPIALIDRSVPIVALAPSGPLFEKMANNLEEAAARGGQIILLSDVQGAIRLQKIAAHTLILPTVDPFVAPILYTIPLHTLAYHVAVLKGTDVDQPRNLAKSVTVE